MVLCSYEPKVLIDNENDSWCEKIIHFKAFQISSSEDARCLGCNSCWNLEIRWSQVHYILSSWWLSNQYAVLLNANWFQHPIRAYMLPNLLWTSLRIRMSWDLQRWNLLLDGNHLQRAFIEIWFEQAARIRIQFKSILKSGFNFMRYHWSTFKSLMHHRSRWKGFVQKLYRLCAIIGSSRRPRCYVQCWICYPYWLSFLIMDLTK